ncbi:MAG: type I restriction endonuclease [Caulobacteraceae bacterium]
MDFIDELKQFSKRIEGIKDNIATEEATKTSMIMPFFQMLGYDVFNPHEFVPEYTADVGIKKGEKVDYAIMKDNNPVILIEAKWCGENLDKYDSQLFRYFGTSTAKFAILTNGIIYRFYTDLDEQNKMDAKPFLEINLLDIKESYINELKKFHKQSFDIDTIFNAASELKYSNEIIKYMTTQLKAPEDEFVKFISGKVYTGVKTQNVITRFREIVRKSMNQFVNELMNEKITSALKNNDIQEGQKSAPSAEVSTFEPEPVSKPAIITTEEEMEFFYTIKTFLRDIVPKEKISYKDTQSYFGILYDNNSWKWICRLKLDGNKKHIYLPDDNKNPITYQIESIDDIYNYKDNIIEVVKRYM